MEQFAAVPSPCTYYCPPTIADVAPPPALHNYETANDIYTLVWNLSLNEFR
jgi:hypothetical protein